MSVAENEEQEAPKGEQNSKTSSSWSKPSCGEEDLSPSISIRRPGWYELTLTDDQKQVKTLRSTFSESRPPKKFLEFMELMSNVIEKEADHQVQHDVLVKDDVRDIVLGPEGKPVPGGSSRSTFLIEREC
jgi:hypothetical protein